MPDELEVGGAAGEPDPLVVNATLNDGLFESTAVYVDPGWNVALRYAVSSSPCTSVVLRLTPGPLSRNLTKVVQPVREL